METAPYSFLVAFVFAGLVWVDNTGQAGSSNVAGDVPDVVVR